MLSVALGGVLSTVIAFVVVVGAVLDLLVDVLSTTVGSDDFLMII